MSSKFNERNQACSGFRFPLSLLEKKQFLYQTPPKLKKNISSDKEILSKDEIMSQLTGITKAPNFLTSVMLGKDSNCKTSKIEIADEIINEIEKKIEKLHRTRKEVEEQYLEKRISNKRNELFPINNNSDSRLIIYDGKERKQYAEHEFSSLECLNLENVQALHEAHRMKLSRLEELFLTEKIKKKDRDHVMRENRSEIDPEKFKVARKLFTPFKKVSKEEYVHQFEEYIHDKQKRMERAPEFIDFDRYQPTSPNPKRSTSRKNREKKLKLTNNIQLNESIFSNISLKNGDILTKFFKKIVNSNSQRGVLKSDLIKELKNDHEILKNISLSYLEASKLINQYPSKNPETLNLREFRDFYYYQKNNKNNGKIQNTCLLDENEINTMRSIFIELDDQKDSLVDCNLFIEKLKKNANINKIINKQALFLPAIHRPMELGKVFNLILQEQKIKKNNYIDWPQFLNYFIGYKITNEDVYDRMQKLKNQNSQTLCNDETIIDLDKNILEFLRREFFNMQKKKNSNGEKTSFVHTINFIETIKARPEFYEFRKELGRKQSERFSLNSETLSEVLLRISHEANEYIDWKDFSEFFTRKGRPNYLINKEDQNYHLREKFFKPPNLKELKELL